MAFAESTMQHMILKTTFLFSGTFKRFIFISNIFICFCSLSYGQDTTVVQKQFALAYYKIEIGMGIVKCPVLPTRLRERLTSIKGLKDYTLDTETQCAKFDIPEGTLTKEQVYNIAIGCGFPAQAVNILVDNKPFETKTE